MFPKGSNKSSQEFKKAIMMGIQSNSQSSGYCYKKDGEKILHIKKGFLKETPEQVAQHILDLNLGEQDELMVHGRIPTHGASDASQAHPFVCSSDPKIACMEEGTTELPVISHNGTFHKLGERNGPYSDSAEFAMKILSDPRVLEFCKRNPEKFVEDLKDRNVWGWSRVGIMFPDRDMMILGTDWKRENSSTLSGIFSNGGYKDYVYNKGGVESSRSCSVNPMLPPHTGQNLMKKLGGAEFESSYAIKSSKEGSVSIFSDAIFRTDYGSNIVFYSNTRIIPNIFNYLFLKGSLNVAYKHDSKVPQAFYGNESCEFIIKFINKESTNVLIVFPQISSVSYPVSYKDLIKYCTFDPPYDYTLALNLDLSTHDMGKSESLLEYDIFDAFASYEDLLASSTFTKNGKISKSYSKKLYHVLERHVGTLYFSTNEYLNQTTNVYTRTPKLLHNLGLTFNPAWCLLKDSLSHSIHTNSDYEVKNVKLLGLFLFFIERTPLADDMHFSFSTTQVHHIIVSAARRYNLIYKMVIPSLVHIKEQEKELNSLIAL